MKNFGVTGWGRVVFYDFDEICPLTDCNFRDVPRTDNALEELSTHSYFDIAENDIFPSQFKVFFSANEIAFNYFNNEHSNLFLATFWQGCQKQVHNGFLPDVYPYKQSWRF